jgi:uncharacterized protein (TIGR03435 family)
MIRSVSCAGLVFLVSSTVFGQSALPLPTFEAASVKPVEPGDAGGSTFQFIPAGGLKVTNGTLKGIIETAYDVRESGGPNWVNSERYDISAKAPEDLRTGNGAPPDGISETRRRLQTLLAQRFQLKVHRETKELPVYALAAGMSGSKLVEGTASSNVPAGIRRGCSQMTGMRASMANLAFYLSRQLERPVLDHTGLSGRYDFQLDWTPDSGPCSALTDGAGAAAGSSDGPSIFMALQETLGLKLESTKGPVDVIVIDHAEKADEN